MLASFNDFAYTLADYAQWLCQDCANVATAMGLSLLVSALIISWTLCHDD